MFYYKFFVRECMQDSYRYYIYSIYFDEDKLTQTANAAKIIENGSTAKCPDFINGQGNQAGFSYSNDGEESPAKADAVKDSNKLSAICKKISDEKGREFIDGSRLIADFIRFDSADEYILAEYRKLLKSGGVKIIPSSKDSTYIFKALKPKKEDIKEEFISEEPSGEDMFSDRKKSGGTSGKTEDNDSAGYLRTCMKDNGEVVEYNNGAAKQRKHQEESYAVDIKEVRFAESMLPEPFTL